MIAGHEESAGGSATPSGERTTVTSILLASDQRAKSSGLLLPAYSGTPEQIVFAFGNRSFRNLSKSGGGSVTTTPVSSFRAAINCFLRSSAGSA